MSRLSGMPEHQLLGRKPYAELPPYCKAFDVGLIPFALNELTRNVNPIKLREYLSAGLPVVSTRDPGVRGTIPSGAPSPRRARSSWPRAKRPSPPIRPRRAARAAN